MSGGIDSSVAAWILKRDAHDVVGVTFRFHDGPLRDEAVARASRCARQLGIEHRVIDMCEEFARVVKEPAAEQFAQGCFPNPCTTCTRELKMSALFEQADAFGCELVATGHYARVTHDDDGYQLLPYQLRRPADKSKDQTYLLYALTQDQLARIMFPLWNLHKGEVRRMAMRAGLVRIAPVNDGQGEPCFYDGKGHVDWLEGEGGLVPEPGDVVYVGDGSVVGAYERQYAYEPDQSLGLFEIAAPSDDAESSEAVVEELFAIYKSVDERTIHAATRSVAGTEMCMLRDVRWTSIEAPQEKRSCRARVAYARKPLPAQVVCTAEGVAVAFAERVGGVRAGQPIVLYSDDLVLGGGLVVG